MIRNFFSTPNVIGRLMLILLFASGAVFAGAFNGFVVEIEASSCCGGEIDACGGGMDDAIFSSSGNNCDCLEGTKTCACGNNPTCGGVTTTDYCGTCKCLSSCCTEKQCKNDPKCNSEYCTHSSE